MLVVLYKCLMHLLMNKWAVFHLVDILFSKIVGIDKALLLFSFALRLITYNELHTGV